jgi:eukaryotic-like serine/threonine-protein kinase
LVEADIREAIGTTYLNLGLRPEAEIQMERALALKRKILGEDRAETAVEMNNLATLYIEEGKFAEAEPLEARAFTIWRAVLGEEHLLKLRAKSAFERYQQELPQPR